MSERHYEKSIYNSFVRATKKKEGLLIASFFADWFRHKGGAYFFLFKKNLRVTNIQFAELAALIKLHARINGRPARHLQFLSPGEFNKTVKRLVESFAGTKSNVTEAYRTISRLYSGLFLRTVILDPFFGSCALFVPPGLDLSLAQICGESGYVHSCGRSVFVRKLYKVRQDEMFSALERHLTRHAPRTHRAKFVVFAHEDFTSRDRTEASEARNGLDDVKIFVEKFYVGNHRLVRVLKNMQRRFKGRMAVVESGNLDSHLDRNKTIWLLVEHGVGVDNRHPSDSRYCVCFEQMYKNENPFHIFDENKPAWIDHTTLPHTLAGAMINLCRPSLQRRVKLADPFVGTGTIVLESLKHDNIDITATDTEQVVDLLVKDNLSFFTEDAKTLRDYCEGVAKIVEKRTQVSPRGLGRTADLRAEEGYRWALQLVEQLIAGAGGADGKHLDTTFRFTRAQRARLASKDFRTRLILYVILRAVRRHLPGIHWGSSAWEGALKTEAADLTAQIERLATLRERPVIRLVRGSGLVEVQGEYSEACSLNVGRLRRFRASLNNRVQIGDARRLTRDSVDLIVTDPPYGFNSPKDMRDLAELYRQVIRVMVMALKEDGQLVFAVPDWSHTGRQLPSFTFNGFVTHQVLVTAADVGKEVINVAYAAPGPSGLFRPPYYWESDRALRRAILHFRFRSLR